MAGVERKDIRTYWPDISEEIIQAFNEFDEYEWVILSRIFAQKRFAGHEINEDDLLQSFPSHKLGEAKGWLKRLVTKQVLHSKPKPACPVYSGHSPNPVFLEKSASGKILARIRDDDSFKKALINRAIVVMRVSSVLEGALEGIYQDKAGKSILKPAIRPSETLLEEGYGAIVPLVFICPTTKKHLPLIEYEVTDPRTIFTQKTELICPHCRKKHIAFASGKIM